MHKPKHKLLFALLITLLVNVVGAKAQTTDEFTPAFLMNTPHGIVFYGVNLENEIADIGRLPDGFGVADAARTLEWRIRSRGNFLLSSDRQHVAFIAKTGDSGLTGLFIYNLKTTTLTEAVMVEDCSEFYPPTINWSPDGGLISVLPGCSSMTGESRIVYRLADQERLTLPDDYTWGDWAGNNTTLLYRSPSDDLKLFDTENNLSMALANVEKLTVSPLAGRYLRICQFTWSEYAQRWFFESGCLSSIDYPMDYVYSVDLEGQLRLEVALPDFYSALLPGKEATHSYQFINLHSVIATDLGVYLLVEVGLEYSHWSMLWYEGSPWMRPSEIFRIENSGSYRDTFADVAYSPDKDRVAMVDFEGHIKIVSLPEGALVGEIQGGVFDNEGAIYRVDWLDNNRLVYIRTDGGVGIFNSGLADSVDTNLAAGLEGDAFIFRQRSS